MAILSKVDKIYRDKAICDSRYDLLGFFEHCNGCKYESTIDDSGNCKLSRAYDQLILENLQKAMEILGDD